jgi:hypothetical protein
MGNYYVSFVGFLNKMPCPEGRVEVVNVFGNEILRRIFE